MNPTKPSFESLFRTGPYEDLSDLSDSKLRTEDGYIFDVHRVILARANRYFHALFRGIGKDKRDFLVPGVKGRIMEMILMHIYSGTIHFTQSNICELMVASDYLLADDIMLEIKKFAKYHISLNNCIPLYMTALKISNEDILRRSYRYIQTHFEVLASQEDIGDIPFEAMKQLLGDKNLCVSGEYITWFAIVKWTQGNITNRLCYVPDFLQSLTFADIDESLATEILCHDIVGNNNFCKDLNEIKSRAEFENSLSIFLEYYTKFSVPSPDFCSHRSPAWMHLIARYHVQNLTDGVQVFITYDENLDLWRKIGETDLSPTYFTSIGHSVYMFDPYNNRSNVFNIFENQWREMIDFQTPRVSYCLVNLQNVIYVIGGESLMTGEKLMDVEFYCSARGMWFAAMPMMPITSYSAVAFEDSIYVVGKLPENLMEFEMMAQVYDAHSESWTIFSPPSIFRYDFALVAYHGKLYIVGGSNGSKLLKEVERFDFERNAWETIEDLPYTYYLPKAIVLNDRLVIFDGLLENPNYLKKNPPVFWNETEESWKLLDQSLPSDDLALYLFCTVDDSERIAAFLRENRDPRIQLQNSPFS